MPQRIQRKRTKGWKMPPNTVYVGRPTKWGNPYKIGQPSGMGDTMSAKDAVDAFRGYLIANQQGWPVHRLPIGELRGKSLACFCPHNQVCHADVLLEIANSGTDRKQGDGE